METFLNLCCKYCSKKFSTKKSIAQHEIRCINNPNRMSKNWDKILETRKKNTLIRHGCPELEMELDNDGKLWNKWKMKVENAKHEGLHCLLTFEEYCLLVKQAGLKSSDLGFSGGGYVLARYGDKGDYTFDNCRFITQKENSDEKVITDVARRSYSENIRKLNDKRHNDIEFHKQLLEKTMNSTYYRNRHEKAIQKEMKRVSNSDPRRSGIHNSSYGTHWITNGVESRKWHPDKEPEIPEGWRLGRVVKSSI